MIQWKQDIKGTLQRLYYNLDTSHRDMKLGEDT